MPCNFSSLTYSSWAAKIRVARWDPLFANAATLPQLAAAFGEANAKGHALGRKDRHYLAYAITHVIYALSNFNERALPPHLFPPDAP